MGAPILGELMSTTSASGASYNKLFIPRMGDIALPATIKIYQLDKAVTRGGVRKHSCLPLSYYPGRRR